MCVQVVVVALGLRKLNTPIVSTELTQHMLDTPVTLRAQELEESEKAEQQAQLVQHDQGDSPHARMSTSTRTSTSMSNNKLNNSTSSDEANPC